MYLRTQKAFTLVELIIGITIFSVFIVLATASFATALSNIQYIKAIGEEQESMLYDSFIVDQTLGDSTKIYEVNDLYSTGYLFKLDEDNSNYPFATLDLYNRTSGDYQYVEFGIKKLIPVNDMEKVGSNYIFSSPGDNDIKNISDGSSFFTNTGVLNNPTGLYSDGTDLFISDTGNNCIRTVSITSGSAIGGCIIGEEETPGNDDGHLISPTYLTSDGTYLYISDTYNNKIRRAPIAGGTIEDVLGDGDFGIGDISLIGTNFELDLPTGIVQDSGYLYVSDTGNNRVLKVNTIDFSTEVFAGNGDDATIWVGTGVSSPEMISLSAPTTLKISGGRLFILESKNGVLKSVNLSSPYDIRNELGSYENIAYFGDFETSNDADGSYTYNGFSGSVVSEDNGYIPFSGYKSLKLIGESSTNGSLVYNFDAQQFSPSQGMNLLFYMKSLGGSYDIEYGFTSTNTFIGNKYGSGTLTESWKKFYVPTNFPSTQSINGIMINVSTGTTLLSQEFLLDYLQINTKNINITGNTSNKFENNFGYVGSFYIDGTNSYISELINGKNYNFSLSSLGTLSQESYDFHGINLNTDNYLFDDYMGQTRLSYVDYGEKLYLNQTNTNGVVGIKLDFRTYNGYYLDKYIGIKD